MTTRIYEGRKFESCERIPRSSTSGLASAFKISNKRIEDSSELSSEELQLDEANRTFDSLTVEEALQININGKPFMVTMRTPGDDISLVRGLLHTEGILSDPGTFTDLILKEDKNDGIVTSVDLSIPQKDLGIGYANSRSLLSISSCGICGRTELENLAFKGKRIDDEARMDYYMLHEIFQKMNAIQYTFLQSGGTHAAAAFTIRGEMICSKEDIGRHNAVDKVIGDLILSGKMKMASCLTVSGRISYEIVVKCFKARIPFLAAISAPSSLAVDYAKEFGITLFGFCRENRATCYSHPQRTKITKQYFKAG